MAVVGQRPFPTWPQLGEEEVLAAAAVLRTNQLSQLAGPHVEAFEQAFAVAHGASHCVATSSGTAALHATLLALGIGPGAEVLVPAHSFIASATPVTHVGATPVFVDIDPATYCIDPTDAAEKLTPRTAALVAVHLNGHPADLQALTDLCRRKGIALVEDACQAHGAGYAGRPVGTFGNAGCFSFWHDKTITTAGEGGAVLTNDAQLASVLRKIRSHGETQAPGERLFHHDRLGHNFRLTSVQAAVGLVQVGRLAGYVSHAAPARRG